MLDIYIPFRSAIRSINETECSSFLSPFNQKEFSFCALFTSTHREWDPSSIVVIMGRLPSLSASMEWGLFRVLAGPSDINQRSPKAPILGRTISGSGRGRFFANLFTWRKGSIKSSFADSLWDAGTKHFSINCFIAGSFTLESATGFIPCYNFRIDHDYS